MSQFRTFYLGKFQYRTLDFLPVSQSRANGFPSWLERPPPPPPQSFLTFSRACISFLFCSIYFQTQGQVVLKGLFGVASGKRKTFELHVSEYQALVLLAFNPPPTASASASEAATAGTTRTLTDDAPETKRSRPEENSAPAAPKPPTPVKSKFTFLEMHKATGIPRQALQETLLSLCSGKMKLLRRSGSEGKNTPLGDQETVIVNDGMKSKLVRIVVHSYQGRLTKKDTQATEKLVQRERQFQVDAAIVRLLKARRSIGHQV